MGVSGFTSLELEGQDAHADEVASVDTLVALSDDSVDALEVGALGGPIARGARAVLFASKDDQLLTFIEVLLGCVEDGHLLAGGHVHGGGTDLWDHLVNEANVGKGATSHDLIVTSAGTVGVVVLGSNTTLLKVAGSRRVLGDFASWRDVIGSDRVTDVEEAVTIIDGFTRGDLSLSRLEEGRVMDVGGSIIPIVELTLWGVKVLPHL